MPAKSLLFVAVLWKSVRDLRHPARLMVSIGDQPTRLLSPTACTTENPGFGRIQCLCSSSFGTQEQYCSFKLSELAANEPATRQEV